MTALSSRESSLESVCYHAVVSEVTIAVSSGKDKAGEKARTMARQRGRKACRSRRRPRLAHDNSVEGQEEAAGDQETFELVIRAEEPPRGPRAQTSHGEQ